MIRLHQFPRAFGLPNASGFCMKLETYLVMAALPYESVESLELNKAPKGKMPWIEDGGVKLGDSSLIIAYLKQRYGDPLDGWLRPEQKAQGLAFKYLLEEHLYWVVIFSRWAEEVNWPITRDAFFGGFPAPVKVAVSAVARKKMLGQLHAQGMGRHSRDEVYAMGIEDTAALADFMADKPYLLGARPSSFDATLYAFLANVLWVPIESPLKEALAARANLVAYCERMRDRYFR